MSTPPSAPDDRGALAVVLLIAGILATGGGAFLLWGPGGCLLAVGLLAFALSIILGWQ